MKIADKVRFLLNDDVVELERFSAHVTLLDYLRLERGLCGTKEGCAEGDCGACTVLIGRLNDDEIIYETANACIRFLGSLNACHVVTIEALSGADGGLHPVQQAMVDAHASQCGFCTPGIVMSLYDHWLKGRGEDEIETETALQGNLCRCTGYQPIIAAAKVAALQSPRQDSLIREQEQNLAKLRRLDVSRRIEVRHRSEEIFIPADVADLAELRCQYPQATIIAGATDVGLWVTKQLRPISPVIFIGHLDELSRIEVSDEKIRLGACVSYSAFEAAISAHLPQLAELWSRIGGAQIRNMGTIGGNIANGSPIGDTPPALIVLGASVQLRCGGDVRSVMLEDFFIDYGKQDRREGDFIESIEIPLPGKEDIFSAYKISKRRDEDISALCGVFRLIVRNGIIETARIAFGGMAAIPKRAFAVEALLHGRPWELQTIMDARAGFSEDYTPLSDWRASSGYRLKTAENLLLRLFHEWQEGADNVRLPGRGAA